MSGNFIEVSGHTAVIDGIEVGTTDIRDTPELMYLTVEDEFDTEVDQYRFDRVMDIAFESDVCWEEFGDSLMEQWERERLHSRLCESCLSREVPLEPWAKPGFLWAMYTGGASIDNWFVGKRTARECGEAGLRV